MTTLDKIREGVQDMLQRFHGNHLTSNVYKCNLSTANPESPAKLRINKTLIKKEYKV